MAEFQRYGVVKKKIFLFRRVLYLLDTLIITEFVPVSHESVSQKEI